MADTLQAKMHGPKSLREKLTAWDAKIDPKASLTNIQKDGFMELTTHSANRPLPVEVARQEIVTCPSPLVFSTGVVFSCHLFCSCYL